MPAGPAASSGRPPRLADARIDSGGAAHRGGRISGYVDHGHHASFRLDWFRRVGGYDASFSHNGDAELDHRIALAGGRIWLDAGIRVAYSVRPTLAALARQYSTYGTGGPGSRASTGCGRACARCSPPLLVAALLLGLPLAPATPLALFARGRIRGRRGDGQPDRADADAKICGLWAGPAMAAMHLAWGWASSSRPASATPAPCPDYPDATVTASRRHAARSRGGRTVSG